MLYNVIKDGDSVSYVPTTAGKILLIAALAILLAAAAFCAGRRAAAKKPRPGAPEAGSPEKRPKGASARITAKQMAFCAMAIALGTVLSNLKVYSFPFGGSVTLLSMLIICLPGYWFGLEAGLITGMAYGVLQLIIDPYVIHPVQLLFDYLLAFGALGLSGLFTDKKNGLLKGYCAGILGRWLFTALSGWIFFAEYAWEGWHPLPYTFAYNGCYIFAEAAITYLLLAIPYVRKTFARVKQIAVQP